MKQLQAIFEKQMDRREFLGYIGASLLAVIGVSGMIKALLQHSGQTTSSVAQAQDSYGSTAYGGITRAIR
jgi:hypothetical protein